MNHVLKKTALALVLAGACGLASALDVSGGSSSQTFNAGLLTTPWNFSHSSISTNFTDIINFTLTGASDFSYFAHTLYLTGISTITPFNASLDGYSLTVSSDGVFRYVNGELTLPSGAHYLTFSGAGAGLYGGSYGVQIAAAPVPEPESWALLLAGFGFMGVMARRRSKWMTV